MNGEATKSKNKLCDLDFLPEHDESRKQPFGLLGSVPIFGKAMLKLGSTAKWENTKDYTKYLHKINFWCFVQ